MSANETIQDGKGNIVEQIIDNGDGTGTRTLYAKDGTVKEAKAVTGLPVEPVEVKERRTAEEQAKAAHTVNDTYLALAKPTAAESAAQVRALTKQVQALIRLAVQARKAQP